MLKIKENKSLFRIALSALRHILPVETFRASFIIVAMELTSASLRAPDDTWQPYSAGNSSTTIQYKVSSRPISLDTYTISDIAWDSNGDGLPEFTFHYVLDRCDPAVSSVAAVSVWQYELGTQLRVTAERISEEPQVCQPNSWKINAVQVVDTMPGLSADDSLGTEQTTYYFDPAGEVWRIQSQKFDFGTQAWLPVDTRINENQITEVTDLPHMSQRVEFPLHQSLISEIQKIQREGRLLIANFFARYSKLIHDKVSLTPEGDVRFASASPSKPCRKSDKR